MNPQPAPPVPGKWAGVLAGASALARAPWLKLLGREPDCWRRTLGLGLRSEGTRFALSSFNLRIPADSNPSATVADNVASRFIQHFSKFIAAEPAAHFVLRHYPYHVERMAVSRTDLVQCDFGAQGELLVMRPQLDPREAVALDSAAQQQVENIVVLAHRLTRHLSDIVRFPKLEHEVRQRVVSLADARNRDERMAYAARLLAAGTVSVESLPAGTCARFLPPDFRLRRGFGGSGFDTVIRPVRDGRVDVWLNIHHTACDGAPMQEMLSRLEAAWGTGEPVQFPAYDPGRSGFIQNCQTWPEDRPISVLVDFLDFTSLAQSRAALNRKLAGQLKGPVPVAAMILWALAHEPEFAGRKFATAVDVPPDKRWPRAVDLVAIRPGDYFTHPDGFLAFVRNFIDLVAAGQARRSPTYAAMRALSFVAPRFAAKALASHPDRTRATFGTVGLSMLRNAKAFVAPMADAGWDDGFIALGNVSLSAGDGRTIGVLTIKGEPGRIAECARAFRQALDKAHTLFENVVVKGSA